MNLARFLLTPVTIVLFLLSFAMGLTGCTSLLPIGAASPDSYRIGPNGIDSIHEGEHLVILAENGDSLSGEFLGKVERTAEEYYEQFVCWRERLSAETLLPAPGEMARIQWELPDKRVIARGVFAGADTAGVYVTMAKGSEVGAAYVPITDVISIIDEHGRAIDVSSFADLIRQGQNAALTKLLRGRGDIAFNGLNVEKCQGRFTGFDHGYLFFHDSTNADQRVVAASVHELSGERTAPLSGMMLNRLMHQESPPGFISIVVRADKDTVFVGLNRIQSIEFYPSWLRKSGMKTLGTALLVVGGVAVAVLIFDLFIKSVSKHPV